MEHQIFSSQYHIKSPLLDNNRTNNFIYEHRDYDFFDNSVSSEELESNINHDISKLEVKPTITDQVCIKTIRKHRIEILEQELDKLHMKSCTSLLGKVLGITTGLVSLSGAITYLMYDIFANANYSSAVSLSCVGIGSLGVILLMCGFYNCTDRARNANRIAREIEDKINELHNNTDSNLDLPYM